MPWDFLLIFFLLAVVVPLRGRAKIRKLLALPGLNTADRLALYAATIASQWALAAFVAWRCWARGFTPAELGLVFEARTSVLLASLLGTVVLAAVQVRGWKQKLRLANPRYTFQRALAERIFPRSSVEAAVFFALALTAGLCEEFLYRGFLMAALARMGLAVWIVVAASSVLFGLAHAYQGLRGAAATAVVGLLFGAARLALDTLAPVILWHVSIDVAAGAAAWTLMERPGQGKRRLSS